MYFNIILFGLIIYFFIGVWIFIIKSMIMKIDILLFNREKCMIEVQINYRIEILVFIVIFFIVGI